VQLIAGRLTYVLSMALAHTTAAQNRDSQLARRAVTVLTVQSVSHLGGYGRSK
jgi:hypothetical protein